MSSLNLIFTQPYKKIIRTIHELHPNIERINFLIDLQNLSIGAFIPDESYLENNLEKVILENFNKFLYDLGDTISYSRLNNITTHFYCFTDTKRNLFNEALISTWKSHRKKSFLDIENKDEKKQFNLLLKQSISDLQIRAIKTVYKMLYEVSKYTKFLHTFILEYIDSDFLASLIIMLRGKRNNELNIILSADKDFLHLFEKDKVFIYRVHKKTKLKNNFPLIKSNEEYITVLSSHFNTNEENAEIIKIFYPIYHAIIGDIGDGFKSLKKGIGNKTTIKLLKNILVNYNNKWEVYEELFINDSNFLKWFNEKFGNEYLNDFLKRLIITDHEILSYLMIKNSNLNNLKSFNIPDIIDKFVNILSLQQIDILKNNGNFIYDLSKQKNNLNENEFKRFYSWLKFKTKIENDKLIYLF